MAVFVISRCPVRVLAVILFIFAQLLLLILALLLLRLPRLVFSVAIEVWFFNLFVMVAMCVEVHLIMQLELALGVLLSHLLLVLHQTILVVGEHAGLRLWLGGFSLFGLSCGLFGRPWSQALGLRIALLLLSGRSVRSDNMAVPLAQVFTCLSELSLFLLQMPDVSLEHSDLLFVILNLHFFVFSLLTFLESGQLFCFSSLLFELSLSLGFFFSSLAVVDSAMCLGLSGKSESFGLQIIKELFFLRQELVSREVFAPVDSMMLVFAMRVFMDGLEVEVMALDLSHFVLICIVMAVSSLRMVEVRLTGVVLVVLAIGLELCL